MKGVLVSRDMQYLFLGKCEMLDARVLIIQVALTILRRPTKVDLTYWKIIQIERIKFTLSKGVQFRAVNRLMCK